MSLEGKIAVVTGASRGVGRGIALQLGAAGATVYISGRSPVSSLQNTFHEDLPTLQKTANEINERGGKGIAIYVDHSNMDEVEKFFKKIETETDGVIDILVNNAFSAANTLANEAGKPFWECDPELWDEVNNVGLRNHYYCCVHAARLMVPRKRGLIVNISSIGGLKYFNNVAYGVGKTGMDRMAGDMAEELRAHNVTMISLWPGVKKFKDLPTESPEFSGKAVVALASDQQVMKKTGRIIIAADAAIDYKFKDIDGTEPGSLRSLRNLLILGGLSNIAAYAPPWLRLPGWALTAFYSRL